MEQDFLMLWGDAARKNFVCRSRKVLSGSHCDITCIAEAVCFRTRAAVESTSGSDKLQLLIKILPQCHFHDNLTAEQSQSGSSGEFDVVWEKLLLRQKPPLFYISAPRMCVVLLLQVSRTLTSGPGGSIFLFPVCFTIDEKWCALYIFSGVYFVLYVEFN